MQGNTSQGKSLEGMRVAILVDTDFEQAEMSEGNR